MLFIALGKERILLEIKQPDEFLGRAFPIDAGKTTFWELIVHRFPFNPIIFPGYPY